MFLETNSAKSKFLNKYFQSVIQGRRFSTDGPLRINKLTIQDLSTLSRESVSNDYPRVNRSVLEEVLDDFQLETSDSFTDPESSTSSDSTGYSCEDVKEDFIEYVKTLRPKPTISKASTKKTPRSQSYSVPSTSNHKVKSDFRKTQSLQSVVSHISTTTSSSITDSDYSVPTTDDEEISPTRGHPKTKILKELYVLSSDKGKLPESRNQIAHQLSFATPQQDSQLVVSSQQAVIC